MKVIRLASLALIWVLAATMHAQSYKVLVNFNGTLTPRAGTHRPEPRRVPAQHPQHHINP